MRGVTGRALGYQICQMLGIEARGITDVTVGCPADGQVTVTLTFEPSVEQLAALGFETPAPMERR